MAEPTEEQIANCTIAVKAMNDEQNWHLDPMMVQHYIEVLCRLSTANTPNLLLPRIITNYHTDHAFVEALLNSNHHDHDAAWLRWMPQCIKMVRSTGLVQQSDGVVDVEDLAQIANAMLARSLKNYRYESKFSSWAYRVILNTIRTELRAHQAQKRAVYPESLDKPDAEAVPIPERDLPELVAASSELLTLVHEVLNEQPDPRLAYIFHLWAIEQLRVVDIGKLVHLSEGRIRVLINHCLSLLRSDWRITHWATEVD